MWLPVFFNKMPLRVPTMAWFVTTYNGMSDFFNRIPLRVPTTAWFVGTRSVHDTQRGVRIFNRIQKRVPTFFAPKSFASGAILC